MKSKCIHKTIQLEVVAFKNNSKHVQRRCSECGKQLGYQSKRTVDLETLPIWRTEKSRQENMGF